MAVTTDKKEKKALPKKKVCEKCELSKNIGEYYNGDKMFFPSGKISVCKSCALKIVEENGHEGLLGLLRMLNKPFYQDMYKNDVADYVRMMNSMPQYRNVTFTQSDSLAELLSLSTIKRAKPKELTEDELRDSEDYWGIGNSEQEYLWLNTEYSDYLNRYEVDSKTLENLIREICLVQLDIRVARANKRDVKNELRAYNDLLTAANLKPVQETGNLANESSSFGLLIKKWEDTRPIQDDTEWKKNDSIGEYLKVWFTGHLMRMFSLENKDEEDYYKEINKYTVVASEDEGDDNGRDS